MALLRVIPRLRAAPLPYVARTIAVQHGLQGKLIGRATPNTQNQGQQLVKIKREFSSSVPQSYPVDSQGGNNQRSEGNIGRRAEYFINDLSEPVGYSAEERLMRCKLASLYRLVDLKGWTHSIYNHITVRLNHDEEQFLLNPYGQLYHEITASSLVKVNMQGETMDPGSTGLGINTSGFVLHSAIHAARPDVECVIHVEVASVVAVSCLKAGLLPISQDAMGCGPISYHDFCGILVDEKEQKEIAEDLGPTNKVMFLRNHGVVVCGTTVEEAWHLLVLLEKACDVQAKITGVPSDQLVHVSEDIQKITYEVFNQGGAGCDVGSPGSPKTSDWDVGQLEFEAQMRRLDNAGYGTGYQYKQVESTSAGEKPPSRA